MPGYILHLTEAGMILDRLKEKGSEPDSEWRNLFLLGNLLPDTLRKTEKVTSHFWDPDTLENLAIAPDLNRFMKKYAGELQNPLVLGYWTHLQLDYLYVKEFWDRILEFRDSTGATAQTKAAITRVYLKQKEQEIPRELFFTSEYYYGDYTRMNGRLVRKHGIQPPVYDKRPECPVTEVEPEDLKEVLQELGSILERQEEAEKEPLRVFDLEMLETFIEEAAEAALPVVLENQKKENQKKENQKKEEQRKPRLFAFDLDGTLLRNDRSLSEKTVQILERCAKGGDCLVVASGRPLKALPENVMELSGITHALTSNGVAVYDCGSRERIIHTPMMEACAKAVLGLILDYEIRNQQVAYEVLVDGIPYTTEYFWEDPAAFGVSKGAVAYIKNTRHPLKEICDFAEANLESIDAINIVSPDPEQRKWFWERLEQIEGLYLTHSMDHLIEISGSGAGKGAALKALAEHLEIPRERVYAFGNEANDMDMLRWAGCGAAVANSPAYVKEIADRVIGSNEEDGVAEFLQQLLEERE